MGISFSGNFQALFPLGKQLFLCKQPQTHGKGYDVMEFFDAPTLYMVLAPERQLESGSVCIFPLHLPRM
jgi:hypothetical protein